MTSNARDDRDDAALLRACVEGERRAWETLVARYARYIAWLIRLTCRRCGQEPDDDDVSEYLAEVFAALLENDKRRLRLYRGDNGCTVRSWLRVITVRKVLDLLRRRRPEVSLEAMLANGAQWSDDDAVDPLAALVEGSEPTTRERLRIAAGQLSPTDRALLEMLYVQRLPAEAAAAALGIARGALYTRKTRLVQRLKAILDEAPA